MTKTCQWCGADLVAVRAHLPLYQVDFRDGSNRSYLKSLKSKEEQAWMIESDGCPECRRIQGKPAVQRLPSEPLRQGATLADLKKTLRQPKRVKITKREIVIRTGIGKYLYRISRDRIRTYAHLLGWLDHLSQKEWGRSTLLNEFISAVSEAQGLPIDHGI